MKLFFIIMILSFPLYAQFSPGQPEFYMHFRDNPGANYRVLAVKYGITPIYDKFFSISESYDYVWERVNGLGNPESFYAGAGSFTTGRGFDWVPDPISGNEGRGVLGYGLYQILIQRETSVGSNNFQTIFQFFFDVRHLNSGVGSPDLIFNFDYSNGSVSLTVRKSPHPPHTVYPESLVELWSELNISKDWSGFTKNAIMLNDFSGTVRYDVKTTLNQAEIGFPMEVYSNGYQFTPGNTANFWKEVTYQFGVPPLIPHNNILFRARNWNSSSIFGEVGDVSVSGNEVKAIYNQTHPLTVTNNLEGGTSNDEFEIKWQDAGITYPRVFNSAFDAFKWQTPTFDDYTIKALPITVQRFGTNWTFKNWNTGSTYDTIRDIRVSAPTSFTANYKGHFRSNNSTASGSNGQRKLMRDEYGIYHLVYTSMDRLWYTKSLTTDYGGSWSQEVDLDGDYDPDVVIKNPSIDINGDEIVVVYEYKLNGVETSIYSMKWNINNLPSTASVEFIASISSSYFGQAYPVVAFTYRSINNSKEIFVVYRTGISGSLKYSRKHYVDGAQTETQDGINLPGTNFQSKYPSIAGSKTTHKIFIAYSDEQRYIRHTESDYNVIAGGRDFLRKETISTGSGYTYNHSPSISLFGLPYLNFRPIISWTATNNQVGKLNDEAAANDIKICIRPNSYGSVWGNITIVGESGITSQNASTSTESAETVIAWSQNNGVESKYVKRNNGTYTFTNCIDPAGNGLMISNGNSFNTIKALTFSNTSLPYAFNKSSQNFYTPVACDLDELGKITTEGTITFGRSGLVIKNGVEFIFNIGDVVVNDSIIQFIEKHDTIQYVSTAELNSVVRTNTFELDSDAGFLFSNLYYVNNSEFADTALTEGDAVSFKAELVNAATQNAVGTFDNITYDKNNLAKYENISYQVNCSGIQPGEYYLRLVTAVNGEADYNLANVQSDASIIEKKTFTTIYFDGKGLPETYEISQNYPNPFNPSTVINYQIPKDGLVSIKVYDILGKEVKTLVNENKSTGRYSVQFNGDNLASGVYIYRITSGDFVSSRKMMMIK